MKPARILRAIAESRHQRPEPTPRELEREERILAVAQTVMAEHGRHEISFTSMALALRMVRSTLRHHFCDLDELLAAILHRHLRRLSYAIGEVPQDAPDRLPKMRAAYLAHTRTILGGYTEAHLLLVRDRHLLPAELLTSIDFIRHNLGDILAYGHAEEALDLLDSRYLSAARIEEFVAMLTAPQAEPEPAQPPITAAAPLPPAEPPATPAQAPKPQPTWLDLAFEPPPDDPTNDLFRVGRGYRALQNPQPPAQAPPKLPNP
jgi:AcrR family transcriptional regulator